MFSVALLSRWRTYLRRVAVHEARNDNEIKIIEVAPGRHQPAQPSTVKITQPSVPIRLKLTPSPSHSTCQLTIFAHPVGARLEQVCVTGNVQGA